MPVTIATTGDWARQTLTQTVTYQARGWMGNAPITGEAALVSNKRVNCFDQRWIAPSWTL